ncbi:hypothetical protein FQZ97_849960 [compost metagenome]
MITGPPMLRNTGMRLPISKHRQLQMPSKAIMGDNCAESSLRDAVRVSTTDRETITGSGTKPTRISISFHQNSRSEEVGVLVPGRSGEERCS